jgi:hypothetical protein
MNKKEGAARYKTLVEENEQVIVSLIGAAAPASFDGYAYLNYAAQLSDVTDNFNTIWGVLDPSRAGRSLRYGGTERVRVLLRNMAGSIVVLLMVDGDVEGRVTKAFGNYFTTKGFKTATTRAGAASAAYLLAATLEIEAVDMGPRQTNKAARYVLNVTVVDRDAVEVFAWSGNGREAHVSEIEARQRAIRKAEAAVGQADFANEFDAYLSSLLQ